MPTPQEPESSGDEQDLTLLLQRAGEDPVARRDLLAEVYGRLRAMAQLRMSSERQGHTLQATELVHEVYLKLAGRIDMGGWNCRAQFFGAAAEAMRRILIDHARGKRRQKRGSGALHLSLDGLEIADENPHGVLALDEALEALAKHDERMARIVKLRFYAGLSVDETASVMEISRRTVLRDWKFARAWLFDQLSHDDA